MTLVHTAKLVCYSLIQYHLFSNYVYCLTFLPVTTAGKYKIVIVKTRYNDDQFMCKCRLVKCELNVNVGFWKVTLRCVCNGTNLTNSVNKRFHCSSTKPFYQYIMPLDESVIPNSPLYFLSLTLTTVCFFSSTVLL